MLTADRKPDLPAPPLWFLLAIGISLLLHVFIVAQFELRRLPTAPTTQDRYVVRIAPPVTPTPVPRQIPSTPPLPVHTVPEILGEQAVTPQSQDRRAPNNLDQPAASELTRETSTPSLDPDELRAQLREQTRTDARDMRSSANPFALKAQSVWRDSGQVRLPGTVASDNTFTGMMHEITDASGIVSEENFTDAGGIAHKMLKLKNGQTLCGQRMPKPNFEHFAEYVFTWSKC